MDQTNSEKPAAKEGDTKASKQSSGETNAGIKPPSLLSGMGALPKLGDKAALDAFMEKNRGGSAFVGLGGPGLEKKPAFGAGGMFGNLAPLGGLKSTKPPTPTALASGDDQK